MPARLPGLSPRLAPLALVLAAAASGDAPGRLWRAVLLDPRDFLPGLPGNPPDTALVAGPALAGFAEASSGFAWDGLLDREEEGTGERTEALSAGQEGRLWVRPLPGMALGASWQGALDRDRHVEPGGLDVRLGRTRGSLGAAWVQGLLAPPGPRARGAGFLDFAAALPDRRRQGFAWMLAGGRAGVWRLEYGLARAEEAEAADIVNLDTAGSGEAVRGLWSSRTETHRVVGRAPFLGGSAAFIGEYATGRPRRPRSEYWFSDSSRALGGRLGFSRPAPGALGPLGSWEAFAAFREAEAVTLGRRIPPGSEGLKRWHYARHHAILREAGADAGRAPPPGNPGGTVSGMRRAWGWKAGFLGRSLDWRTDPPPDALGSRRETLSYNRLGLSFIASLYGGLYKVGEVVAADGTAGIWEGHGALAGRLGPWEADAGLSLFRTRFALDAVGLTLSQRLVSLDTAEAFRASWRGHILGATPRLRVAFALLPGGPGRPSARLEAEAAQVIPFDMDARRTDAERRGGGGGGETRLPLLRNGFEARARLVAGF